MRMVVIKFMEVEDGITGSSLLVMHHTVMLEAAMRLHLLTRAESENVPAMVTSEAYFDGSRAAISEERIPP